MAATLILLALSLAHSYAFLPNWVPTYNMSLSTVVMPCNDSGMFDATTTRSWGLVDFDWSNAKQIWANEKPMDCQERLITQAAMVKQVNPATKVFIYRNLVKALPWYSQVREKLDDPNYSGWFLKFKDGINGSYHVPACTAEKCSVFYHDQDQTPEHPSGDGSCTDECDCGANPCGEYLWDHRNASLREWLVDDFVLNPDTGLRNPNVDGYYLDDSWTNYSRTTPRGRNCDGDPFGGPTEEHPNCTADMGLTQADTTAIFDAWRSTINATNTAILQANGFSWPMFAKTSTPTPKECTAFFRLECGSTPRYYHEALRFEFTNKTARDPAQVRNDVAAFLLVRGDYAWIGYDWIGCVTSQSPPPSSPDSLYYRPPELDVDYGTPSARCQQDGNVFTREYSHASVTFDCSTYKGSVTMK